MTLELTETLQMLTDRRELTHENISLFIEQLTAGRLTDSQIAGFLIGLRAKGETVAEIAEIARRLRDKSHRIHPNVRVLVDTCGTGGDGTHTFNISTTAAFVVAGAGIAVAKHGNRSVSSRCGSADVLERLGVNLQLSPKEVERTIERIGIGFLFAPAFHPAMKYALAPRKELGIRTVFNVLGPLLNPAGATHQVVGVYDPRLTETLASVLLRLGVTAGLVVHGCGLDEITLTGPTRVTEFGNGSLKTYEVVPEDFGLQRVSRQALYGGSPEEGARILQEVLEGKVGPHRDVVLLNAGAAIYISGRAATFSEGVALAGEAVDSGAALAKLQALVAACGSEVGHGLSR